jgi:hypothetical protein
MECPECNTVMTDVHRAHDIEEAECYQWECQHCGAYTIVEDEDGSLARLLADSNA